MKKEDIFTKLFQFSIPTFYNWQREKRPIIKLLEKYFTKDDLEEFLETGNIQKFEQIQYRQQLFKQYREDYLSFIHQKFAGGITNLHEISLKFYFQYLYYLKNNFNQYKIHTNLFHDSAIAFSLHFAKSNKMKKNDIDAFYTIFWILDYLDTTPGMQFYFQYLLHSDLKDFIEDVDISNYMQPGTHRLKDIRDIGIPNKDCENLLLYPKGLDQYYFYHCYNNIAPYSIQEIEEE